MHQTLKHPTILRTFSLHYRRIQPHLCFTYNSQKIISLDMKGGRVLTVWQKKQLLCRVPSRAVAMMPATNSEVCQISRNICLNSDVHQISRHNIWPLLVLNIYPSLHTVGSGADFEVFVALAPSVLLLYQFNHNLGTLTFWFSLNVQFSKLSHYSFSKNPSCFLSM